MSDAQLRLIETIKQRRPVTDLPSDDAIPAPEFPASESREHFFLKHLARNYWIGRNAKLAAVEVYLDMPAERDEATGEWRYSGFVDVMAMRYMQRDRKPVPLSIACEVKVSRADFLSGFHERAGDLNYIVTQPNIIEADDLPPHVGWLLYDPDTNLSLRSARQPKQVDNPILNGDAAFRRIARALMGELRTRRNLFGMDPFQERAITCPDCGNEFRLRWRCKRCGGRGKVVEDYTLLTRPAATETGGQ